MPTGASKNSEWELHSAATRRLIDEHGLDIVRDPDFPQLYINYHRETLIEPARTRGFGSESGRRLVRPGSACQVATLWRGDWADGFLMESSSRLVVRV